MINHSIIKKELDEKLSTEYVFKCLIKVLTECSYEIILDDKVLKLNEENNFEIVYKNYIDDYAELFFTPFKVCVALGGITRNVNISAKHCFSYLYFNDKYELVTIDWDEKLI